ncbi:DUF1404 domain-containing protein [Acidianus sp. RZ1]|uniref:DUF1404 domain-containing protein n=1 Tax=Acidianus sp. RZ1 TaxID=1540082 RepID=UPI001C100237|nr:DUF1404 domain-containing protein [Acidianus sp. RZ1]
MISIKVFKDRLNVKSLAIPLALLVIAINPFTELEEFSNEWLYMAMHYVLFIAGFILGYKIFKGSGLFILLGIASAVFWHTPLFFNLGGAVLWIRIIEDSSLFFGGMFAGLSISSLNNAVKVLLFVLWMAGDSVLSVILIVGWPPYSNEVYPFSPFSEGQELLTGLVMFGIMTVIFIYIIVKLVRGIFNI